jgi:hypothetical protein
LHNAQRILDSGEVGCPKGLADHRQCSRDHSPHKACRHGLVLRAVNTVQRIAKVLGKFGSVSAEFE